MRSLGELMEELGFNKDASFEAKKAFIKHLIKAANPSVQFPDDIEDSTKPVEPQQLSFNFDEAS